MKPSHPLTQSYFKWGLQRCVVWAFLLLAACSPVTGPAPGQTPGTPDAASPGDSGANARPTLTPPPSPTPPTSALSVQTADLQGVEISLWHAWFGSEAGTIRGLVDQFNRENTWGITAREQSFAGYDELDAAVGAALSDGEPPSVAVAYLYQALEWERIRTGLVGLDVFVDDPLWGLGEEEQADFFPVFWEHEQVSGSRLNGRIAVPAQRSAQLLYYNVTWAEELGFDSPPATPAQFKQQACAAARANRDDADRQNDATGGLILSTHYSASLGWLHAYGAQVFTPNQASAQDAYQLDQPAVQQAFHFLRDLYDDACAWLPEEVGGQDPLQAFAVRRGLFSTGSVASIPAQEGMFADLGSRDEWTVIPFIGPGDQRSVEVYGPSFYLLKAAPEQQLAAWLLVRWLLSAESQARLAQANAWLPVRLSGLQAMDRLPATYPQWAAAADLLASDGGTIDIGAEPPYRSWRTVRWALSDATTQLFRYYFTIDQVPQLVRLLDQTAADFHP